MDSSLDSFLNLFSDKPNKANLSVAISNFIGELYLATSSRDDFVASARRAVLKIAGSHNDFETFIALRFFLVIYDEYAKGYPSTIITNKEYRELYFALPDRRLSEDVETHTLLETKAFLLKEMIKGWTCEFTPEAVSIASMLSDIYEPVPGGRASFFAERTKISELVKQHVNGWVNKGANLEQVETWIVQACVHDDFKALLAVVRARIGGAALAVQDIRTILQGVREEFIRDQSNKGLQ